jgi:hypothetical protein
MILKGTITFEFNADQDPIFEMFSEDHTLEEKIDYFREVMAEDLGQMSLYDNEALLNCIEMEVVEA